MEVFWLFQLTLQVLNANPLLLPYLYKEWVTKPQGTLQVLTERIIQETKIVNKLKK